MRHESNESEQGLMAELCEHEKETWNPLTKNLMTSHISLCKEESAGCSGTYQSKTLHVTVYTIPEADCTGKMIS